MATTRSMLKASPTAWRLSAVGIAGSRPYLMQNFPATVSSSQGKIRQLQIQWKTVLLALVETLGGTEPVFTCENTSDRMFQIRVSFSLPLDKNGSTFENIVALGNKCFTMWEAESEASAAALQKFEGGRFGTKIMDVSRARCEEFESRCCQLLAKADELYGGIKLMFSSWEENIQRTKACYSKISSKVVEDICYGAQDIYSEIRLDVSDSLVKANKAAEAKFKQMFVESEEGKNLLFEAKERADNYFYIPPIAMAGKPKGDFPSELRISMKIILQEIANTLGWDEPACSVTRIGAELYVCETLLVPGQNDVAAVVDKIKITGPETSSEIDAVESDCKAVILFLESKLGICVVDINYNGRSHVELHVSEAEDTVKVAFSMGNKILGEWETMVNAIQGCEDYCEELAAEHPEKNPCDEVYYVKRECTLAVDHLHKRCSSDFQLARRRFINAGACTDE